MSDRAKIAVRLALLLVVTGLIGFALYMLFFGRTPSVLPPAEEPGSGSLPNAGAGTGLPSADGSTPGGGSTGADQGDGRLAPSAVANGGLTQTTILTSSAITSPITLADGSVAYYDPNDGRFYTIDEDGNVKALSQAQFPAAETVTFAPQASAAVLEFPDGSNVVYDFNANSQVTLPSHWEDFSFSSDAQSIASKSVGASSTNRSLVVTSKDGSNTQVIAALGANDDQVIVNWSPDGNVLGFSKTGGGGDVFGQNDIYLIGPDGEASGVLVVNGSNFIADWSPDSQNLLYSVADAGDEYRASLWYGDSDGDRRGTTRLRLSVKTTADKCGFASDTVAYCAVPTEMPSGGGANASLVTDPDNVYKIDLPSGRATLVAIPAVNTRMFNVSVSPDGSLLYFTDGAGRLTYMNLK